MCNKTTTTREGEVLLATTQGVIVASGRNLATIVGAEHQQRVVPHSQAFHRGGDVEHCLIHEFDHPEHLLL